MILLVRSRSECQLAKFLTTTIHDRFQETGFNISRLRLTAAKSASLIGYIGQAHFLSFLLLGWPPFFRIGLGGQPNPSSGRTVCGSLSSETSVIVASVSSSTLATDTAFSKAIRTTFVGSMIPASIRLT